MSHTELRPQGWVPAWWQGRVLSGAAPSPSSHLGPSAGPLTQALTAPFLPNSTVPGTLHPAATTAGRHSLVQQPHSSRPVPLATPGHRDLPQIRSRPSHPGDCPRRAPAAPETRSRGDCSCEDLTTWPPISRMQLLKHARARLRPRASARAVSSPAPPSSPRGLVSSSELLHSRLAAHGPRATPSALRETAAPERDFALSAPRAPHPACCWVAAGAHQVPQPSGHDAAPHVVVPGTSTSLVGSAPPQGQPCPAPLDRHSAPPSGGRGRRPAWLSKLSREGGATPSTGGHRGTGCGGHGGPPGALPPSGPESSERRTGLARPPREEGCGDAGLEGLGPPGERGGGSEAGGRTRPPVPTSQGNSTASPSQAPATLAWNKVGGRAGRGGASCPATARWALSLSHGSGGSRVGPTTRPQKPLRPRPACGHV